MATTTDKLTARQRARQRIEQQKADEIAREKRQIAALATYYDESDKLTRHIARGEAKHRSAQRDALAPLVEDGMSPTAIAKLIGTKPAEVKAILEFESATGDESGDAPDDDTAAESSSERAGERPAPVAAEQSGGDDAGPAPEAVAS